MAKKGMRAEVKAQKLKNNKTANLKVLCKNHKTCENEAVVFHGTFESRVKVCYTCFTNPPQVVAKSLAKQKKAETDHLLMVALGLV